MEVIGLRGEGGERGPFRKWSCCNRSIANRLLGAGDRPCREGGSHFAGCVTTVARAHADKFSGRDRCRDGLDFSEGENGGSSELVHLGGDESRERSVDLGT